MALDFETETLSLDAVVGGLACALTHSPDGAIVLDTLGVVAWMNPRACALTGRRLDDAIGSSVEDILSLFDEQTLSEIANPGRVSVEEDVVFEEFAATLIGADTRHDVALNASPIVYGSTTIGGLLTLRDVSQERARERELSLEATIDPLTELLNRREFERRFEELLPLRDHHALVFIDLDGFKLINDSCGHEAGDDMLRQVARILMGSVRSSDLVARFGGDEFALALAGCPPESARGVVSKMLRTLENSRFSHDGESFRITASAGVALLEATRDGDLKHWLKAADRACYIAKTQGKNRAHYWTEFERVTLEIDRLERWAARIDDALENDRFELFGQRVENLRGGLTMFEVLLRLRERTGKMIGPREFLDVASRFELATRIDRWVIDHTLELLSKTSRDDVCLSINLTGASVADSSFHGYLDDALSSTTWRAGALCFEISERSALTNILEAGELIEVLRRHGALVALDDFGTGGSSFGYLKQLGLDYLKIDESLVRRLRDSRLDEIIVRSFRDAARALNAETIAEGVESPEILAALELLEIDRAQGFLLHEPESLAELLGLR